MSLEKIIRNKLGILATGTLMALTSCGGDNNPTTPNNPPNTHIEHQQEITNSNGFSTFNDDGNIVEIQVKDQNNNPIPNATVDYLNGENNSYDIFIVSSPNHLSELKAFQHNSKSLSHVIGLMGQEVVNYSLRTILGTDEREALTNFIEYHLPQSTTHAGSGIFYAGTKTTEQVADAHAADLNLSLFVAQTLTGSQAINVASTVTGTLPITNYLEEFYGEDSTWDIYKILGLISVDMKSNKPSLNLNNPIINNLQLTINATTQDLETYCGFIPDPTNRILGPTENFDPTYTRKIIKIHSNGEEELISLVQNIPNPPPWTIPFNRGEGEYRLELIVTDDTRVNTTQDQKEFTIGGDPGVIILEPTNDTFIHRYTMPGGIEESLDEINGEDEHLFLHHHYIGAGVSSWTERYPLISFNIPQTILDSEITSAELQISGDFMVGSLSDFRIHCNKINSQWDEGTATWRNAYGKIGEELMYIELDMFDYDSQNPNKLFSIDLTPHIQNIPYGVAFTSNVSGLNLHSKEYPGEEYDPKLIIHYTPNNQ